jgi:hypothetical protein
VRQCRRPAVLPAREKSEVLAFIDGLKKDVLD